MLSLSASHPTVSATTSTRLALRLARRLHHRLIDALDEIVPTLIQLVDVAFRGRNLMIVLDARLVLLVPQLDVRLRQARDQHTDGLVHLHLVRAVEPPRESTAMARRSHRPRRRNGVREACARPRKPAAE